MHKPRNTKAFYLITIVAFVVAFAGTMIGLLRLESDIQTKGFFAVSYVFSIYSTFALAKVVRDNAEDKIS